MIDRQFEPVAPGGRAEWDEATLEAIATHFRLGVVSTARDLGGTYNLNLLLETSTGRYVARVHRPWITRARLAAIQRVRLALHASGLPVLPPLASSTGQAIMACRDRLVEVEAYVAHDAVADRWDRYEVAVSLLGRLHDALLPLEEVMRRHPPAVSNYGTPDQLLGWTLRTEQRLRDTERGPDSKRAIELCTTAINLLVSMRAWWNDQGCRLPLQAIHGDYGGGNILFCDHRAVAILDFDFLGVRERVYELAYSLYWMLSRLDGPASPSGLSWNRVPSMLERYSATTARPLTDQERESLPLEMARVPLYWIAEAAFLPNTMKAVLDVAQGVASARWIWEHRREVAELLA